MRADIFIAGKYPKFTRSSLEMLFRGGKISLNSKPLKPSYKLRHGDILSVDEQLLTQSPEPIELPVIYEDDDVVVINKPAGLLTHSKGAINNEATVASFVGPKLNDKSLSGNRAGIVHRLDRATSGVLIAAKNDKALKWLQKQFSTRKVKKTYLAVVEGLLKPQQAIIDAPIARNPKKPQTFYVNQAGKAAQTEYEVLNIFKLKGEDYSMVRLKPLTGRTHQIRVHMAYINHPVVGDWLYGKGADRLMLHSAALELTLPNRQRQTFTVPAPEIFRELDKP